MLDEAERIVREAVNKTIKRQRLSITTNLWTYVTNKGFMSLTVNFVTKEWEMAHLNLEYAPFDEQHTAENSAKLFEGHVRAPWTMQGGHRGHSHGQREQRYHRTSRPHKHYLLSVHSLNSGLVRQAFDGLTRDAGLYQTDTSAGGALQDVIHAKPGKLTF